MNRDQMKAGMIMAIFILTALILSGCNSIVEDRSVTVIDHKAKTETTTVTKLTDESFTLGTKGQGDYQLIKWQNF